MTQPPGHTASDDSTPPSREQRRRRTEAAILAAAKESFAGCGYERTTIRGVARTAGVDPALVMQYFGNKEGLFAAASRWDAAQTTVLDAGAAGLPQAAFADFFGRFEGDDRDSAIALLRACLTHPTAMTVMRDEVMCERAAAVAAQLEGDDADVRAGLIGAVFMGLAMARYLVQVPAVASASRDDLERLLGPALRALAQPPPR